MWHGLAPVLSAYNLLRNIASAAPHFSMLGEQDAHEFLELFLDILHEATNTVQNKKQYTHPSLSDHSPDENKVQCYSSLNVDIAHRKILFS